MMPAIPNPTPMIIVVSAPSGAGKTTICQGLLDTDSRVHRVITCTTRPPRGDEQNGKDYHFLSPKAFEEGIRQGEFLEHAHVYGNLYGTRRKDVFEQLNQGKDVLLNIDIQGASSIRDSGKKDASIGQRLITVFLMPPSLEELESRLRNRNQDKEEIIRKRLGNAENEISEWLHFDYLIVSGTRNQDLHHLQSIVRAERLNTKRRSHQPPCPGII